MTEVLAAAGSPLTTHVVDAPARPARVLACFDTAVYLDAGGTVLPVVTSDALLLPTAVRLPIPSTGLRWGVGWGDCVRVGQGRIEFPDTHVDIRRTWRPARVRDVALGCRHTPGGTGHRVGAATARRADELRRHVRPGEGAVSPVVAEPGRRLAEALTHLGGDTDADGHRRVSAAVRELIGLGPGLTPSGDDLLAGLALVTCALDRRAGPRLGVLERAFDEHAHRTTLLSASLLHAALAGYGVPQLVRLVDGLVACGPSTRAARTDIHALARAVARIGHHSGSDLLAGVHLGLRVAADHAPHLERTLR